MNPQARRTENRIAGGEQEPSRVLNQEQKPGSYFLGGVTLIVPKSQLQELDMPVEQAVKLALTGWIQGDLSNLADPAIKKLV